MGLTNRNMAARFSSIRGVLGAQAYEEILGRHGYQEVTNIPSLEKAREVYSDVAGRFPASIRRSREEDWECRVREDPA